MVRITECNGILYLILPKDIDCSDLLSEICSNTGMRRGSFADSQVIRIFKNLLGEAENLHHIYDDYYSEEYDSFKDYLYKKENCSKDFIKTLSDNETVYILRYSINNYSIRDIIGYEEENLGIINQMMQRAMNEGKKQLCDK